MHHILLKRMGKTAQFGVSLWQSIPILPCVHMFTSLRLLKKYISCVYNLIVYCIAS